VDGEIPAEKQYCMNSSTGITAFTLVFCWGVFTLETLIAFLLDNNVSCDEENKEDEDSSAGR